MHIIIILGVSAFLATVYGVWQAIKSVSEGSNFDEGWGSLDHYIKDNTSLGYKPKPLQWFLDRIGKKVYRDVLECECPTCREVEKDGLLIHNENHAAYLCAIDEEFWVEGVKCNYRDEK